MSSTPGGYPLPLATGELSPQDARELQELKALIKRDIGFYCEGYKEHCLRRRIAVRMRARGVHTYAEYADLLKRDEGEHRKLLDTVTINVSKFYRNHDLWKVLERVVVPQLFDLRARKVGIWSAGCAAGEEPYSVAMLLKDHALRTNRAADLAKFDIVGSDIDRMSLEHALIGKYGSFAFTDIDPAVRRAWFTDPDLTEVKPEVRQLVRFERRDLIKDDFEPNQHMIICRNVIIYFERAVQEQLFVKFHEALAPGGFLVLGKVESIFGRGAGLFKSIAQRERVFVKA